MGRLILARLLHSLVVVAVVSVGAFALMRYTPGDPVAALTGESLRFQSPQEQARIRRNLGLDDPFWVQYGRWAKHAVRGDLGYTINLHRPVSAVISERLGASFLLMGASLIISVVIGLALGVLSAIKRYSALDYAITIIAFVGNSLPQVWIGLMFIFLFALKLHWLPVGGMTTLGGTSNGFVDRVRHLVLPMATLAFTNLALWARYQRASMLDVLGQDYVQVARAKGLRERSVILRHAWRNSLVPIVTLLGNSVIVLIEGAYIVETIFAWPGLGRLGVDAILKRDYPVVMGVVLLSSAFIITGNLCADLAYGVINPRLRRD